MKERMHSALILCDFDRHEEIEKATEIKRKLGELGIHSSASDLENDGFTPSTPWLEYDGVIYYSHEIDEVIDQITHDRATSIYRGHKFSIKICEGFTSKYNENETPRVKYTIENISNGEKYVAYRTIEATSPTDPLVTLQAHRAIDYYINATGE